MINPVHLILALMAVTLVCAAAAPVLHFTAAAGSKQQYIAKFVGGLAYILLGVLGLLTFSFVHGNSVYFTVPASIAFVGLGVAMFHFGAKARRKLLNNKK